MYLVLVNQTSVICISLLDTSVESFALATLISVYLIGCSQAQSSSFAMDVSAVSSLCYIAPKMQKAFFNLT